MDQVLICCCKSHGVKENQCGRLCRLTKSYFRIKYSPHAEVAELADALGSGLSGRKVVRVQVPPSAPYYNKPAETRALVLLQKMLVKAHWKE